MLITFVQFIPCHFLNPFHILTFTVILSFHLPSICGTLYLGIFARHTLQTFKRAILNHFTYHS